MNLLHVPEFVNPLRSPEIDSQSCGPVQLPYLTYRPARRNRFLGTYSWALSTFTNSGAGNKWQGWPKYLAEAGTLFPPCRGRPPWRRRQFAVGHESWGLESLHTTKVRIYKEYHSVCPLVGIGTLPTPLSPASVPHPPRTGGTHSPAGEGLGESQFRRLEKKLSTLPTLCCIPMALKASY